MENTAPSVSLWPTESPRVSDSGDRGSVEVGVKFTSSVVGEITGIRFYKSTLNTGTHRGNLWNASGERLATSIFTTETDAGWQSVTFTPAIMIEPETTYVASYFAPEGGFSVDEGYFSTSDHTNGPLTATMSGTDGANGLYRYGGQSGFPTYPSASANYWVDVIFTPEDATVLDSSAAGDGAQASPGGSTGASSSATLPTLPPVAPQRNQAELGSPDEPRQSVRAIDSANYIPDGEWFQRAYAAGFRLYVMHSTGWGTCIPWDRAEIQLKMALDAGLKVAAYTRDPRCWKGGIEAAGPYMSKLQFFALDVETGGEPVTREMVDGVAAMGIRPVIYTGIGMWHHLQGEGDFSDIPLWDASGAHVNVNGWRADFLAPPPVRYAGWNTPATMRIGVQQHMEFTLNGVNVDLNSFDASFLTVP